MDAPSLTRRRALALGAAAGLSSVFARAVPSAWARSAPSGFGLTVAPDAFAARRTTPVLRAPRRFDLLGVRDGLTGVALEVRVRRRRGAWSPWVPLAAGHDHRPDTGTGAHASDPVWAGGADELQLRAVAPVRRALRVHFVAVPAAAKRRGARAAVAARAATAHAAQAGAQPTIIARADWGGDAVKPRATPAYGDVQVAFVHHTVSANDYAATDSPGIVLSIAKYHRDVNGWNDLGYNFVVDKYGQVFEGRAGGIDQAVIGAQAQGYNSHSTGIANIGTFTDVGQTDAALDAMAKLIAWKLPLHGAPVSGQVVVTSQGGETNRYKSGTPVTLQRISGHRDGDATECPGSALYAQLPTLRARTAAIAPAVTPAGATALTLDTPAASVTYGDALTVSGTLKRGDGTAIAGRRVLVQKQGRSGWTTVARTETNGDGAWSAQVAWRAAGRVRARATVPGAGTSATSGVQVGCTPVLSAKAKTTRIKAGRALAVSGTVHPLAPVYVKVEQQGKDGKWRTVRTQKVAPRTARFAARVPLTKPGLYRLTPRTGTGAATARAAALYVRAVRKASSLNGGTSA